LRVIGGFICQELVLEDFGSERQVSVSRELTKLHEETFNGTAEETLMYFQNNITKGEFVVIVAGKEK